MRRKTKNIAQSKKTTNLAGSRYKVLAIKKPSKKFHGPFSHSEMRFKISLVILMALLIISAYLLAMVLVWQWSPHTTVSSIYQNSNGLPKTLAKNLSAASQTLDDSSLDFKLTLPKELGDWIYKTGFVKDPLDDSQSDQYVKIYLPLTGDKTVSNFDSRYEDILTIIKFPLNTWNKLDKGCQKGNSQYCNQEGTKIVESDNFVFAYIKADDCPKEIQSKCSNIGKIIDSFTLR